MPCEHQYAFTNPIPELAGTTEEATHVLLRHQDRSMYFRQHFDGYGIGNYRHTPRLVEADAIRKLGAGPEMPSINAFRPDDFATAEAATAELLPPVMKAGVRSAFNGMFSFTPDGMPVMGESPAVPGLWVAEAVWITHGGGVGKTMAEWIATGEPEWDVHEADINRFHAHMTTPAYVRRRAFQQYVEVYDVIHPLQQMEEPRCLRRSPFFTFQKAEDAVFFDAAGWERPQWFESNRRLLEGANTPARDDWAAHELVADPGGRASPCPRARGPLRPHRLHQDRGVGPGCARLPAAPRRQRRRQARGPDHLHGDAQPPRRHHVRPHRHPPRPGPLFRRHGRRRRHARSRLDAPAGAGRRQRDDRGCHLALVHPRPLGPSCP